MSKMATDRTQEYRKYYEKHRISILERKRKLYTKDAPSVRQKQMVYRIKNRHKKNEYNKSYNSDSVKKNLKNIKAAEYRKRPEVVERMARWKSENKEWLTSYYEKTKDSRRERKLLRAYGLTQAKFMEIVGKQGVQCAICPNKYNQEVQKSFHVDHNHATGEVRGVLCRNCNLLLGYANDDIQRLLSAINYLKKWQK